jgi:hypothetical protein
LKNALHVALVGRLCRQAVALTLGQDRQIAGQLEAGQGRGAHLAARFQQAAFSGVLGLVGGEAAFGAADARTISPPQADGRNPSPVLPGGS